MIRYLFILFSLLISFSLWAEKIEEPNEEVFPVQVISVQTNSIEYSIEVLGEIFPTQKAEISSEITGKIKWIKDENDTASEGELLVQLDDELAQATLEKSKANLSQSLAQLGKAKGDLNRIKNLSLSGIGTQESLDHATSALEIAEANHQVNLTAAQEAEIILKKYKILAPFKGTVLQKMSNIGQSVTPGTPLLRFANLDQLELRSYVNAKDALKLTERTPIHIRFPAYSDGFLIQDQVDKILNYASPQTRTLTIITYLPKTDKKIIPGQSAKSTLIIDHQKAISIPLAAVQSGPDGTYVFIVQDGKAYRRKVELGLKGNNNYEVLNGLVEGDLVIVRGQESIQNGYPVKYTE